MFTFFTFLFRLEKNQEGEENNSNSSCEYNSISYFLLCRMNFFATDFEYKSQCAVVYIDFLSWFWCILFAFYEGWEGRGLTRVQVFKESLFFLRFFPGFSGSEPNLCS